MLTGSAKQENVNILLRERLCILAIFLTSIASTATSYGGNVALPQKLSAIGAMDFYSVCAALQGMGMMLILPLMGVLTSRFGLRNLALSGLLLNLVIRVACVFVTNAPVFSALWFSSGVLGGLYTVIPSIMIAHRVQENNRPRYYGYLATASAVGALVGPIVTGVIQDSVFSNWTFISHLPFAILPAIIFYFVYPKEKSSSNLEKFDYIGLILLTIAVYCIVFWLSMGGTMFDRFGVKGIILLVGGIGATIGLIWYEKRHENPCVPINMFKKKRFSAVFWVNLFSVAYSTTIVVYGIAYVQQVMGGSATISSTVTMPQTIAQALTGIVIGSYVGANFAKRFRRVSLVGLFMGVIATGLLCLLQPNSPMIIIYLSSLCGGLSLSCQSMLGPFYQQELKLEEYSATSGLSTFATTGGSSIYVAMCGTLINMGGTYNHIFFLAFFCCMIALVIGFCTFKFKL